MKLNNTSALLKPFDEAEIIQAQEYCQREMETTLDELRGLVLVADMPTKTRMHLLGGVQHLLNHVRGATKEMLAEVDGRIN